MLRFNRPERSALAFAIGTPGGAPATDVAGAVTSSADEPVSATVSPSGGIEFALGDVFPLIAASSIASVFDLAVPALGAPQHWVAEIETSEGLEVLRIRVASTWDLDESGAIDGADLGLLLANWGGAGPGDLDGDEVVGGADLGGQLPQPC